MVYFFHASCDNYTRDVTNLWIFTIRRKNLFCYTSVVLTELLFTNLHNFNHPKYWQFQILKLSREKMTSLCRNILLSHSKIDLNWSSKHDSLLAKSPVKMKMFEFFAINNDKSILNNKLIINKLSVWKLFTERSFCEKTYDIKD